jgi:hypothetical protein
MPTPTDTTPAANGERVGYRLIRPPGWIHVVLDDSVGDSARRIATRIASGAPAQTRTQALQFFQKMLTDSIDEARANGGQDLYLPTEPVDGIPLSMSIVVAVSPPPVGAGSSPSEALLGFAANDVSAKAMTIDGQLAVRRFVDAPPQRNDAGEVELPASRRITYLTTPPGQHGRILLVTSSILRLDVLDGDRLLEAMEFLFDSMVTTIRFDGAAVAS